MVFRNRAERERRQPPAKGRIESSRKRIERPYLSVPALDDLAAITGRPTARCLCSRPGITIPNRERAQKREWQSELLPLKTRRRVGPEDFPGRDTGLPVCPGFGCEAGRKAQKQRTKRVQFSGPEELGVLWRLWPHGADFAWVGGSFVRDLCWRRLKLIHE